MYAMMNQTLHASPLRFVSKMVGFYLKRQAFSPKIPQRKDEGQLASLIGSRISGGNSAYGRSDRDFYPTPPDVTLALANFLHLPARTTIWEPACGDGRMVDALKSAGLSVVGTDILYGMDFLTCAPPDFDWIITNPPFGASELFIQRALSYQKPFAFLLKTQYWNARRRLALFKDCPPTFILPLTWRPNFFDEPKGCKSPLMDFMWCVWRFQENGTTRYIPLERPALSTKE